MILGIGAQVTPGAFGLAPLSPYGFLARPQILYFFLWTS